MSTAGQTLGPAIPARDQHQTQAASLTPISPPCGSTSGLEFAETASVTLEWKLTGLKAMYEASKGETKSKCIKSAVFGDADNLWEVLWYPNSGAQNGDYASLYLSCVPTEQEREQGVNNKWVRKGLWWFRFEIRSFEERINKVIQLATKEAADHTFAVKTANWGWQQFARRDTLFLAGAVQHSDSFTIVCTITAQPQPPAGHWLGLGLPPSPAASVTANVTGGGKVVGSGGGLSAWAGGNGASGGVAGGTTAGGGVKRVVPKDLVSSVGALLDDQLYSDVEFIILPPRKHRRIVGSDTSSSLRRIFANKKLLSRCDYFDAMFNGGFLEDEDPVQYQDDEDDLYALSDSDEEEEAAASGFFDDVDDTIADSSMTSSTHQHQNTVTTSDGSPASLRTGRTRVRPSALTVGTGDDANDDEDDEDDEHDEEDDDERAEGAHAHAVSPSSPVAPTTTTGTATTHANVTVASATGPAGEGHTEEPAAEAVADEVVAPKKPNSPRTISGGAQVMGPKKTKVVVRDAAWSTWWAVLYWIYTDTIYFAPLSSSFISSPTQHHSRSGSSSSIPAPEARSRREWISQWLVERGLPPLPDPLVALTSGAGMAGLGLAHGHHTNDDSSFVLLALEPGTGPRPVSAKAVYRLADKLDLPALKLRAYQHICGQLTPMNIPAEVFSRFSSTFEDVRKVQVAFFLKHWAEIKKSDTMQNIWKQIRDGKHVGFEEVWPLIISQLTYVQ